MRSTITAKSVLNMGLSVGCDTYAIIKSSDISIVSTKASSDTDDNILSGTIETLETSGENIEIGLRLDGGTILIALEKQDALQKLKIGITAYAIISPLHIIIGL
jgi:molybdate transport system regulatory protein